MAHVRKDTLTTPTEWARHLRRQGKRDAARNERRAARSQIEQEIAGDCRRDPDPFSGSGTTEQVADVLGRRWITSDRSLAYALGAARRFATEGA